MTYCLSAMGMLEVVGNRRRARLYRRSDAPALATSTRRQKKVPRKSEARLA